jgi:hypothetical protein
MVTIPSPVQQGAQTGSVSVDAAAVPFSNVSFVAPNQQLGQDLQSIGNSLGSLAGQIAAKRDRVNGGEAEAEWFSFEKELRDPQNGLYTARGIAASGMTDRITSMTDAKRAEITARYEGRFITSSGKEALETLMSGRSRALWNTGATYEIQQLDAAEQAQYTATLERAADTVSTNWNDDTEFRNQLIVAERVATDMSEGQPQEVIDGNVQAQKSALVVARATRLLQHAPNMVEEFMQNQVDAGVMDQTAADEWFDRNDSVLIDRKATMLLDVSERASTSPIRITDPVQGSSVDGFLTRLIGSESSGRADASVTIDDGRTFSGLGGVGEDRLTDMKNAGVVPQDMTLAQFSTAENADIQRAGLRWAVQDIDRAIDATGALSRGYSRDGLRAVAHIGGKGGMRRYINSGGRYNPNDSYTTPDGTVTEGTSLQDYYEKFAGQAEGGLTADQRIAAETDPRVREAAQKTLSQRRAREATGDARLSKQVTEAIITDYEQAAAQDEPYDLGAALAQPAVIEALGSNIENVRAYIQRQETDEDIVTSSETVQAIEELIFENPAAFRDRDLIAHYGNSLSNSDMLSYLRTQTAARIDAANTAANPDVWSRSETSTLVVDVATAQGVVDKLPQARLLNQAMMIARTYAAENNDARMSDAQLASAVRTVITSTVPLYNPTGAFGKNDEKLGADFQTILTRADVQGPERFLAGEVELELTYQTRNGPVNHMITTEEFASAYGYLYDINNAPPLASQVITALQLYPPKAVEENN